MKTFKTKLSFYFLPFFVVVNAQELPPVQNFQTKDYSAQNQNWAITQGENNSIYAANNIGVLEYNGAEWRLYDSPNETIIRSIKAIGNKIYTGCYMEFGYWQKNNLGELKYNSLTKKLNIQHKDDEQFWNILQIEEWILFQSLDRIYLYNTSNELVRILNTETTIVKMYKTNKGVFFQKKDVGLFKIENGKEELVIKNPIINKSRIVNVFNYQGNLLIVTQNNGFFLVNSKNKITPWNIDLINKFPNLSIYNCIQLKDRSFALGTISNGIIHINKNGEFLYSINQNNGLNDNTVLSLLEDKNNNIWLGLDNGISLINQKSPFKIYNDFNGSLGSIYASILFKDKIYLGTNQGLFYKSIEGNDTFKFVKGTKGQVWSLNKFDGKLFCGHDLGTFIIDDNSDFKKIANTQGTWDVKSINKEETKLLQGNYDGLYVLEKVNNTWKVKNKIKGLDISARYLELFGKTIFINHEYKGVIKLEVNHDFSSIKKMEKLPINKGANSSLIKYNGHLYYSYKDGVFTYNFKENKFVKDTILSTIYNDGYISGKLLVNKDFNELWGFSKNNIDQITPSKLSNDLKINKIPLTNTLRNGVVGYENILKIKEENYLLCSVSGFIRIDLSKLAQKDFEVTLNKVTKTSYHNNRGENLLDISKEAKLTNKDNSIGFFYNSPNFDRYLKTFYQYKLEGIYNSWSTWSEQPEVFFENLPPGDYNFLIRAKIGNTISKNSAYYKFTIAKPWYATNLMIFLYITLFLLFSLFMHTFYRRYYKNQQLKLIENNKKELELAQAKNEKEIIRIKNEKLKEDFKNKSKELATSIMSVVKKNELLGNIKKQLTEIENKEKIKPVLSLIDKSLNQNDDWIFFQEAFNNADVDFLKNLKNQHPNLSPNDLKLCAYLRLNLSSKEIAPLFNISARSVEIKRYRLRKKIGLPHEKNLVDYILNL